MNVFDFVLKNALKNLRLRFRRVCPRNSSETPVEALQAAALLSYQLSLQPPTL